MTRHAPRPARTRFLRAALALSLAPLFGVAPALAGEPAAPGSLSQVFKRVGGSVVMVHTNGRTIARTSNGGKAVSVAGVGSGVLIAADGRVMTAAHVVQAADAVAVEFPGGVGVRAHVVASDPVADVALLQLERVPAGATVARLGNSDTAEVGDRVFVVGAPLGITHTLTVGHLSARRRSNATSGDMASTELFQTDAAINQGNSGGPMFNLDGEVIGIVSHIVSTSGGSEGLGFAVTSNTARRLLLEQKSVWSGVEGHLLAGDHARAFNLPVPVGLLVQRVAQGSPAAQLGVRGGTIPVTLGDEQLLAGGDVILAVEGIALGAPNAQERIRGRLRELSAARQPLRVTVLRAGAIVELAGNRQN